MSRITGSDARGLLDAYNTIYVSQELTEEQIWEEVENWVNSLLEEGYDLSEYTWEEMYEEYLNEKTSFDAGGGNAAVKKLMDKGVSGAEANRRVAQAGQAELNRQSASSTNRALQSGRAVTANTTAASGLLGALGLNNSRVKQNARGELEVQGGQQYQHDRSIRFGGKDYDRLTTGTGDTRKIKYVPRGGATSTTPAAPAATRTPAAPQPLTRPAATAASAKTAPTRPAAPAKPATGMLGKTSFERRTPTSAELKAAQAARAGGANPEQALRAAKAAGTVAKIQSAGQTAGAKAFSSPTAGASAFKPATIAAAPSTSPSASGSVAPATAAIASTPKPTPVAPRQTARERMLNQSYENDAFDLVLEYLIDNGHVETVDEALYVMMEMEAEVIQDIV